MPRYRRRSYRWRSSQGRQFQGNRSQLLINDEKVIACNIETINEKRFYPISSFENKNLCEISNSQESDLRYVYTPKHIDEFTSISNYYIENSGSDSTSIILLDDLSAIEAANVWWSEIKDRFTFLDDWETQIPDSIVPDFHFAYIVEKYLLIDPDRLPKSKSQILDKSAIISNYVKKHDKEKSNLLSIIKDYENKITRLNNTITHLEKTKNDLELKLSDKEREIVMMKQNNNTTNKIRDELISSTLIHSELTSQIQEKNLQIESLQKEIEITNEHNKETVKKLTEEKEIFQQKAYEYNNLKSQYDKLPLKTRQRR